MKKRWLLIWLSFNYTVKFENVLCFKVVCKHPYLIVCLSVYLFIYLSICPSTYLFICVLVYLSSIWISISPDCLWTHCYPGWPCDDLPASASQVLELQAWAIVIPFISLGHGGARVTDHSCLMFQNNSSSNSIEWVEYFIMSFNVSWVAVQTFDDSEHLVKIFKP